MCEEPVKGESSPSTSNHLKMDSSSEEESSENVLITELASKVFRIDEVREIILGHVIHNKSKLSPKMVKSVRLVHPSWLQTTTRLLSKSVNPAVILTLDKNNSLNAADEVKENGKLLDRFTARFAAPIRMFTSLLPVKLNLTLDYFREENFKSLLEFLTKCGKDLVKLEVTFPSDGGSMPLSFPALTLPLLKKLTFNFSSTKLYPNEEEASLSFGNNKNALWLLQNILNGCSDLRSLAFPFTPTMATATALPTGFEFIRLPTSVESLQFRCKMKNATLNILHFNLLPNLINLDLQLHEAPVQDDDLFKVFQRFRKTLKTIELSGTRKWERSHFTASLRFPVMEKLERLRITGQSYKLVSEQMPSLQECLPKLKTVHFQGITETELGKWVDNSKFENVESLLLFVENEHLDAGNGNNNQFKSPSLEMMTKIHTAFSKIIHLFFAFNLGDTSGLTYLFQQMKRLQILMILFDGNIREDSADMLDAIFLGLPLRLVVALKQDFEFWEAIVLKDGYQPSIRNLKELRRLALWSWVWDPTSEPEDDGRKSLISELLMSQGLMKMPKLRNLKLCGQFKPTSKMEQEWKEDGRLMEYCIKPGKLSEGN